MSQYGTIYRIEWNTVPSVIRADLTIPAQAMRVDIFDTEDIIDDADTPEIITLLAGPSPLIISVINNEQDKFDPIRAKQAKIQFVSASNEFKDVTTFSDSPDNRWYVEITADGSFVFKGFLMLADSQQDFLPDPNIVTLTATDHLGVLKDINLTKDDGENVNGKIRIAELIALCLKKTGLSLEIVVVNNLRHGSGSLTTSITFNSPNTINGFADTSFFYVGQVITITGTSANNITTTVTEVAASAVTVSGTFTTDFEPATTFTDESSNGHFYDLIYLDAKTFEQEVGVSEFCYEVLTKILCEDCFLTQWQGKWHIMRLDEYDHWNPIYPATFDADGVLIGFDTPTDYTKNVGAAETRRFANADALLQFDRPNGFIKETYKFDYAEELLCNASLQRGTLNPSLSTSDYEAYDPECWVLERDYPDVIPPNTDGFIKVVRVNGFETERYLQIAQAPGVYYLYYRNVDKVPFRAGDKFKFSVDWKLDNNPGGSGHYNYPVAQLRLHGDDGTHWTLKASSGYNSVDPAYAWFQSNIDWTTNNKFLNHEGELDQDDLSDWQTSEVTSPPLPVTGSLEIFLMHNVNTNLRGKAFAAISLDYIPFVVGTYDVLTGQYNKVSRTDETYLAKREREVFIQDALKPLFKGAMFFDAGSIEIITETITFGAPNAFVFPLASGYKNYLFYPGQRIRITGTNAGTYTVTAVIYHTVPDNTEVQVVEAITTVTESATISEVVFGLTTKWYTSNVFALGSPPDQTYTHPYGYIQAYSVWNQYRNANRIFSTSVLGLGSMWCDLPDKLRLTDTNINTNNRFFLLISFEQNWKTALWSGVFIEDYNSDIGHVYSDPHEFKYITK